MFTCSLLQLEKTTEKLAKAASVTAWPWCTVYEIAVEFMAWGFSCFFVPPTKSITQLIYVLQFISNYFRWRYFLWRFSFPLPNYFFVRRLFFWGIFILIWLIWPRLVGLRKSFISFSLFEGKKWKLYCCGNKNLATILLAKAITHRHTHALCLQTRINFFCRRSFLLS